MSSSSRRLVPRQVPAPESTAGLHASHSRFIPKEELGGFASWSPGPLGGLPTSSHTLAPAALRPGSTTPGHPAGPTAGSAPQDGAPSQPHVDLEALQTAARQAGYHDGYRDGLAALESFKRSFAQQMSAQVAHMIESMHGQFDRLDDQMAQALVQCSVGLARQVIRSELVTRPELVTQVARDTVAAMTGAARMAELRVHPLDADWVRQGLGETAERRGVQVVPDESVGRGGCRLDTDLGCVDADIHSRWADALQRLGMEARQWPLHDAEADRNP